MNEHCLRLLSLLIASSAASSCAAVASDPNATSAIREPRAIAATAPAWTQPEPSMPMSPAGPTQSPDALRPHPVSDSAGWEIGLAGGISVGDGEPANDMTTYGLFARTRLNDDWALRLTLDRLDYDFERPATLVGITQDPSVDTVDAAAESTSIGLWIERVFQARESRNEWFLGAGLSVAFVDVEDAQGPDDSGGTFDLETDAGTEVLASVDAGYRRHLSEHWTVEALTRFNQHFADWSIEDRVSGAQGDVDDYTTWSFLLGVSFGF